MGAQAPSTKRVANTAKPPIASKRPLVDLTDENDDDENYQAPTKKRKTAAKPPAKAAGKKDQAEKRPRRWRAHAPASYLERLERAMNQRMFVLDRQRHVNSSSPHEEITMAGTTGNIYIVTISTIPSCTCPDCQKGNQCKHILYALNRVLKAPAELRYQLSFLPAELAAIFAASPLPGEGISESDTDTEHPNNRKPVSGDCPICFCDMDDEDPKDVVWCKAACGNNVHKACFAQWAKSSRDSAGKVRCVYCRTEWDGEGAVGGAQGWSGSAAELAALKANASMDGDGYANIASDLGLTGMRDTSSYHQPWVRGTYGGGYGYRRRQY